MNKATSMLLSSILSTTVITTSSKVYEDKYQTYTINNLTQLEVMLDGWKAGYNDLNTKLIEAESRIKTLEDELVETRTQLSDLQNTVENNNVEQMKEDEKTDESQENIIIEKEIDTSTEDNESENVRS